MIVLLLTWLLNSLHHVAPYRYRPENALTRSFYGANNGPIKYFADINEIPFHVLIVYSNLYCSGTLVRSKIVMTVASCLNLDKFKKLVVKLGVESITGHGQVIPVIDIKIHEYYKYMGRIDNDIALLMLQEHVFFSPIVKKAVLVEPEMVLRHGFIIEVSGWGSTNLPQTYVNQLLLTEMVIIEKQECAQYYKHLLTPSNFCAKYPPERRLSDNGGPAVYDKQMDNTEHEEVFRKILRTDGGSL
ncbi:unnamed protein product [Spodoptera littoralis]|uniref:Peptidase S1 domain-containing protein n=1 Tax=Spodoptera littoralis TaxID=7109 RepID=A0A9P0IDC2_SPOLI|nr:unnamed protein product [Spodoptera littoralis]CAH1644757.1 unnamed protein product [Spodoptera littoralis]